MSAKDREFIVSLIDNEGLSLDDKEMILSKSPFYRYLYRTYYPVIRNSRIQIISKDSIQKVIVTQVPVGFVAAAPSVSKANVYSPEPAGTHFVAPFQRDTMVVAIKTNLLYDLVTVLNCEIEAY